MVISFLGLLSEVRPFELAIGTPLAFQGLLLPDVLGFPAFEWRKLHALLLKYDIKSNFYSYYNQAKRKSFTGLKIQISDIGTLSSFTLFKEILHFFAQRNIPFLFSDKFDKAIGVIKFSQVMNNVKFENDLKKKIKHELENFYNQAQSSFLYQPYPAKNEEIQ